jgi:hypothetical protein
MRALVDAVRQAFGAEIDTDDLQESRSARVALSLIRRAHSSSSAIFYSTLPAFAYALLDRDRALQPELGSPAEHWPQIQGEMRAAIRELARAAAALDRVAETDTRIPASAWSEMRRYLTMKQEALATLANVPLPSDSQKCGRDLLELCRVVDIWSQQRFDLIGELGAAEGEAAFAGYGAQASRSSFWSRLRHRLSAWAGG